jgi:hypothetical protein
MRISWSHDVEWHENELTASRIAPSRLLEEVFECADASLSESESSSTASLDEIGDALRSLQVHIGDSSCDIRLPQLAIVLQLRNPTIAHEFINELHTLVNHLGPYFGVPLHHALLKTNSHRFEAAALRRASEMAPNTRQMYEQLRNCDGSSRSYVSAIDALLREEELTSVEACERVAQTIIVTAAVALECYTLELNPPRVCNSWSEYLDNFFTGERRSDHH